MRSNLHLDWAMMHSRHFCMGFLNLISDSSYITVAMESPMISKSQMASLRVLGFPFRRGPARTFMPVQGSQFVDFANLTSKNSILTRLVYKKIRLSPPEGTVL